MTIFQGAASKTAEYGQAAYGKVAGPASQGPTALGATSAHTAPTSKGGDEFVITSGSNDSTPPTAQTAPKQRSDMTGASEDTTTMRKGGPPVTEKVSNYASLATEQAKTAIAVAGGTVAGKRAG